MPHAYLVCVLFFGHNVAHVYSKDFKSANPKDDDTERSFYAFDVQSKSARTHQRLLMTGGGQILNDQSIWSQ